MVRLSARVIAATVLAGWILGIGGGGDAPAQPPRVPGAAGAPGAGAVGAATEKLLQDARMDFRKVKDGVYRIVIEGKNGTSVVVVEEKKTSWKDNKGGDVLYAYVWCEILSFPADFKPPTAMLSRLAQLNDNIRFGSVGIGKNPDGTSALYRNGTLFLRGADGEQLADMLYISHNDRLAFQKEFRGFAEEK